MSAPLHRLLAVLFLVAVAAATPSTVSGQSDPSIQDDEPEYQGIPELTGGGWDLYLDYSGDRLTGYAGSMAFAGLGEFNFITQDTGEHGELPPIASLARASFTITESEPGAIAWRVLDSSGDSVDMLAQFASADVAVAVFQSSGQRLYMLRTPCDLRFSDVAEPEIDGCTWYAIEGAWLEDAYFSGECEFGLSCFRLVSNEYYDVIPH